MVLLAVEFRPVNCAPANPLVPVKLAPVQSIPVSHFAIDDASIKESLSASHLPYMESLSASPDGVSFDTVHAPGLANDSNLHVTAGAGLSAGGAANLTHSCCAGGVDRSSPISSNLSLVLSPRSLTAETLSTPPIQYWLHENDHVCVLECERVAASCWVVHAYADSYSR